MKDFNQKLRLKDIENPETIKILVLTIRDDNAISSVSENSYRKIRLILYS